MCSNLLDRLDLSDLDCGAPASARVRVSNGMRYYIWSLTKSF